MTPAERYQFFRKTVQGLHPYKVARALSKLTPGVDWRGCSIAHMAGAFAHGDACSSAIGQIAPAALTKAMEAERVKVVLHVEPPVANKLGEVVADLRAFVSDHEHGLEPDINRIKKAITAIAGEA